MTADPPRLRRDIIAARLADGRSVVATDLAAEFDVSEDAIRRDLRALAAAGRCRRVYGGALPLTPATAPMAARMAEGVDRKQRLARAASAEVRPGDLLFLDSGSTNLAVVDALPEDADLTVVTNSIEIAAAILRVQDLRLIVVGGAADPLVGGCVDAAAVLTVSQMRFDLVFLGACAVSSAEGIAVHHLADAIFKRRLLASARRTIVLATSEKLSSGAPHHVAALDRIDTLVVEAGLPAEEYLALKAAGCRSLSVADPA